MKRLRTTIAGALAALVAALAAPAAADFPYPTCADRGCADPADFGAYLFLAPGELPDDLDPADGGSWKYLPDTGVNVTGAWETTTGRPDVVTAVLDSGIRWSEAQVARSLWLNVGELVPGPGCSELDCNGDGFVSVDDYAIADHNGNGRVDGQDLLVEYSDGVDDDANGFVDDIAGWDFSDDDNDAFDDVDYGHGTGQAEDQVAEANDGAGRPGFAPSSRFVPLRVGDSFVAIGTDFARAVVYATDLGVDAISEALGTLSASRTSQDAIDYAYRRGVPIVASAADEESRHHNLPAALDHTIWVNSIVHEDGTLVLDEAYDYLNGCTNYGGHAWVAISSNSCSSEATGRGAGLVSLLIAHGKNLVDRGELDPYPGSDRPFSAEEIRQLLRVSAEDINHPGDTTLGMLGLLQSFLSAPALGLSFGSERFPTLPGWDQFTGYGRPDAAALLDVAAASIPPEADLAGNLRWFDTVDPKASRRIDVRGSVAAVRAGSFRWELETGCGVQPVEWKRIGKGQSKVGARLDDVVLGRWKPKKTAKQCGFDPDEPIEDPDAHTVTLRLRVTDDGGNVGEDRRTVAIHRDPTLHMAPRALGASAESSGVLVDVDGDGTLDVVQATSDGRVHALRGGTGALLPGFPVRTDPLAVHDTPGFTSGEVDPPHEAIVGAIAAGDLGGDGGLAIVASSTEGRIYAWDRHGEPRAGFPVATDPAFSLPENRDPLNDTDPGFLIAPTLADLDGDGRLHVIAPALDGHLYVWDPDGVLRPGFPVRIADPSRVDVDPATGVATPLAGVDAKERAAKLVGSVAVGDLDGDLEPDLLVTSNEEYGSEPDTFAPESTLVQALIDLGDSLGGFETETSGRIYAVRRDGNLAAGGAFLPGWPAQVPLLVEQLLPTVATGTPGAPALADLEGTGELSVAIFGAVGPVALLDAAGLPRLGTLAGRPRVLAMDFAPGFPDVPAEAGSPDAPFFAALGSGAFGDLTGDGLPEYVAATGGVRKLLDAAAPASQGFGDHQVTAWDPRTGAVLPAFPRRMDDMQFFASPALADVSGDGAPEIVQGSGAYLLRAYDADGASPPGWPKFTHGWLVASPAVGDVDGDGLLEVVAATREGNLYVWDTPAPDAPGALAWPGFGRDSHNSGNASSDVPLGAGPPDPVAALGWSLDALEADLASAGAAIPPSLDAARAALAAPDLAGAVGLLPELQGALQDAAEADPALADLPARVSLEAAVTARAAARAATCGAEKACAKAVKAALKRADTLERKPASRKTRRLARLASAVAALAPWL